MFLNLTQFANNNAKISGENHAALRAATATKLQKD
jgi:hypothetical protein